MGGGGGKGGGGVETVYIAPDVEETPERKAVKSVSSGVNAAAAAQQERAARARGVAASILTNRNQSTGSGAMTASSTGNRTLG